MSSTTLAANPLRMALIGGGGTGFIGKVHAIAATMDGQATLVAGAFSSNPQRSRDAASAFGVAPERAYGSASELFSRESTLPPDERAEFVAIATPNDTHASLAVAALSAGFHVVCDKPMAINLSQAAEMVKCAEASGRVFALMHNYSGYPLVRQARTMIQSGELGKLLGVRVQYLQGWMHGRQAGDTPARGAWKSDPARNGPGGSLGDVGTHAYHLLRFITGAKPLELLCQLQSHAAFHELDDYGHAMLRLEGGASGMVTFSQVTHGRLNDLSIDVDGDRASLRWRQEHPNQLEVRALGQPTRIYERDPNSPLLGDLARSSCRLPAGHPEAFLEAFANVYRSAFADMAQHRVTDVAPTNAPTKPSLVSPYPSVRDGYEGVAFITRCLESHNDNATWKPTTDFDGSRL